MISLYRKSIKFITLSLFILFIINIVLYILYIKNDYEAPPEIMAPIITGMIVFTFSATLSQFIYAGEKKIKNQGHDKNYTNEQKKIAKSNILLSRIIPFYGSIITVIIALNVYYDLSTGSAYITPITIDIINNSLTMLTFVMFFILINHSKF